MFSVSIVTNTFNRLSLLLECIASVQSLRLEPFGNEIKWEHVIIDDASTDGTVEYLKAHTFPNVRFISSPEHRGMAGITNAAIATCQSDYIFELDSDDFAPQRILVNFYKTLLENPDADWIVTDFFRTGPDRQYRVGDDYYGWQYSDCNAVLKSIFAGAHFIQHNALYRRDLWKKVGEYDAQLTMAVDLDLYIRFLLAGTMPLYVPYISHFHRFHGNNASEGVGIVEHKNDLLKLYQKYSKDLTSLGIEKPLV